MDSKQLEMEQMWDMVSAGWIQGTYQLSNENGRFSPRTGGLTRAQLYDPHRFRITRGDSVREGWSRLARGQDEDADTLEFDFFFPLQWKWRDEFDVVGLNLEDPQAVFGAIAAGLGTRPAGTAHSLSMRRIGAMPWPSGNSTLMDAVLEYSKWWSVAFRREIDDRLSLAERLGER